MKKSCNHRVHGIFEDIRETYLAARSLEILLSKLFIAFMDMQDRKYISYKGMQNSFAISTLECSHSMLPGNKTESGELELIFEGTHGDIMKLVTLTEEDKINWIKRSLHLVFYTGCSDLFLIFFRQDEGQGF